MKVIAIGTLKGGTGKTTDTFNICGILAENTRVLMVDLDPQCNLSNDCWVSLTDRNMLTVRDIFENPSKTQPQPQDVIYKSPIKEIPNLDIIPSTIYLHETEDTIISKTNRERILYNYVEKHRDFFERNYDYMFIDTNPIMSVINTNAFFLADKIILVTDVSLNGMLGVEIFYALWEKRREALQKDDNISALIVSNCEKRTVAAREMYSYATEELDFTKDITLKTVIPHTVKIKDSELAHKPINLIHKNSEVADAFREVISELIEKEII